MSVASFLDNLGITANENTPVENDKNLKQGQELMKFERQTIKRVTPHLKLLQITSIPGITSIVETLDNDDDVQNIFVNYDIEMK